MMRLVMSSTYPSVQIKTNYPELNIRQVVSQVQIVSIGPILEINQKESYAEIGMGGQQDFNAKVREASYHKVLEGIGRWVREGDTVLNRAGLWQEVMVFADLARVQMAAEIPELNVQAVPRARPEIRFYHELKMNWAPGGAEIDVTVRPPDIRWQMGQVTIDVRA